MERANEMEQSIKAIAEFVKQQTEELKKNAVTMRHLQELEKRVEERYSLLEKKLGQAKPAKDDSKLNELSKRIDELSKKKMPAEKTSYDRDIAELKRALEQEIVERESTDKDLDDLRQKLSDSKISPGVNTEKIMAQVMDTVGREISSLKSDMNNISKPNAQVINELALLKKEVGEISSRKGSQDSQARIPDIESKEIKLIKAELEALQQTMSRMQTSFEKLKEVKGLDTYDEITENVNDIRRTIDEESAERIAIEKGMQDIKRRIDELSAEARKLKGFDDIDFERLKTIMQKERQYDEATEKKMELQASRIITHQLNEFARHLDKRLPNLATKDDMARLETRLVQAPKIKSQQHAGQLDNRLASLEMTMNSMVRELRSASNSKDNKHGKSFVIE